MEREGVSGWTSDGAIEGVMETSTKGGERDGD